jgi:phosphopantothenoylcysteine decarboxylase/phosphopantothenate--cysteine ligase
MKILLGVTGGIAAYKSAELARLLVEQDHEVRVLPTQNALRFIGSVTLEALSHNAIDPDLYTDVADVKHIEIAQWADVVLVAPATASFLARTASGIADDLLGNAILATAAQVFVAPAMHTEMWENAATRANIEVLESRGIKVIQPGVGRLTGSDSGIGRLADLAAIVDAIAATDALAGRRIVVTLGGTREPIDAVRFIGNYSSGKQGLAIARAAKLAGAAVTVIAANVPEVSGFDEVIHVRTTAELFEATTSSTKSADVLVMVAAVADFRVVEATDRKLKRSELGGDFELRLTANPDVLASVSVPGLMKIGFAAEASSELASVAKAKLTSKGCELIVANNISNGLVFGSNDSSVEIYDRDGLVDSVSGSKQDVATALIAQIASRL